MKYFRYLPFYFLFFMSPVKNHTAATAPFIEGKDPVKTYLALGDSYTIGQSVPASGRFPEQTVALLRQRHIRIADPDIIATTGWTSGQLIAAIDAQAPEGTYAVVSLLIGVNNQYQGRSLEEYHDDVTQLLRRAVSLAGGNARHVFVLSIPDYSVTPFAAGTATARIAREIDQFNSTCQQLSMAAGVHFIDVTAISRAAKDDLLLVATDGLHPSAVQYAKWSALLASAMLPELQ
jgi:lysophospholipase L1-like esterase